MRALKLDYRQDRRMQHVAGFVLLALALAFAATLVWYYQGMSREQARLAAVIEKAEGGQQHLRPTAGPALDPEKTKAVMAFSNRVVEKLNLPWDDLFAALEEAKGDDIALLGVDPNAKERSVKLTGEARKFDAMFDYIRALRDGKMLKDVYLTTHKIDDQNPDKPVRFTLEATWVAKP